MRAEAILADLRSALARFSEALAGNPKTDLERAGTIQYFEFCFELSWKSIQVIAADSGVDGLGSPKSALKHAFAAGWVDDEETWLAMLQARNRMSHTYDASTALLVFDDLPRYLSPMQRLLASLSAAVGHGSP